MARPRLPGGLRTELALAIAAVTAVGVAATFVALLDGTTSRMRSQIDQELRLQQAEWEQFAAGRDLSSPAALRVAARRFIASQRYHAESQIIAIQVTGGA